MAVRHLFVIDPLANLNVALDSSLRMMFALAKLGHEIFITEANTISWGSNSLPKAKCQSLHFEGQPDKPIAAPIASMGLETFAAIHMRKDPPFDMEYIACTWFFDAVRPAVRIYNDPTALRAINEKVSILNFPQHIRPALVSSDPIEILNFIKTKANGDAILKPLDLYGGRGIRRLTLGPNERESLQVLSDETSSGRHSRMVQAFDTAVFAGEVRAFTAFGEPIAWCLKKPAEGNFLANTRMGATLHPYNPNAAEIERIRQVAGQLCQHGVALVGFDLIGGWISEINITSPRLLVASGSDSPLYDRIAQLMDADLRQNGRDP